MYPSGTWIGFWQQIGVGRQPMKQFELHFQPDGRMTGHGVDIVGTFDIAGTWNKQSGAVVFVMAGISRMKPATFMVVNLVGCLAWAYATPLFGEVAGHIVGWVWRLFTGGPPNRS